MSRQVVLICVVLLLISILSLRHYRLTYHRTLPISYEAFTETVENGDVTPSPARFLVYQCGAYKTSPEFIALSREINEAYCKKWGYGYIYIDHSLDEAPPYWLKASDALKLFRDRGSTFDYLVYMDNDAIFRDFTTSLGDLVGYLEKTQGRSFDLIAGKDVDLVNDVNAGVYLIRNSKGPSGTGGKDLVEKWYKTYEDKVRKDWTYKDGVWTCQGCKYAGGSYEQGVLNDLSKNVSTALLRSQFLSNSSVDTDSFTLHLFDDRSAEKRVEILKREKELLL